MCVCACVRARSLAALSNLAFDADNAAPIVTGGAIRPLIGLLRSPHGQRIQLSAMITLSSLLQRPNILPPPPAGACGVALEDGGVGEATPEEEAEERARQLAEEDEEMMRIEEQMREGGCVEALHELCAAESRETYPLKFFARELIDALCGGAEAPAGDGSGIAGGGGALHSAHPGEREAAAGNALEMLMKQQDRLLLEKQQARSAPSSLSAAAAASTALALQETPPPPAPPGAGGGPGSAGAVEGLGALGLTQGALGLTQGLGPGGALTGAAVRAMTAKLEQAAAAGYTMEDFQSAGLGDAVASLGQAALNAAGSVLGAVAPLVNGGATSAQHADGMQAIVGLQAEAAARQAGAGEAEARQAGAAAMVQAGATLPPRSAAGGGSSPAAGLLGGVHGQPPSPEDTLRSAQRLAYTRCVQQANIIRTTVATTGLHGRGGGGGGGGGDGLDPSPPPGYAHARRAKDKDAVGGGGGGT
jgi:hypothetical protein